MSEWQFEVTILDRLCKGCGLCVEFCEPGKIVMRDRPNRRGVVTVLVRPDVDCTGCRKCATMCPDAAVQIVGAKLTVGAETGEAES